jgi:hypothetical protein
MGSGISMSERELDKQELFVEKNFDTAKRNMSKYKDGNADRYTNFQIKMKLREEYHNRPYSNHNKSDKYINSYEWKSWNNV